MNMVEFMSRLLDIYDMTNMGRLTSFLHIRVTWEETSNDTWRRYCVSVRDWLGQGPRKTHCPAMPRTCHREYGGLLTGAVRFRMDIFLS